MAIRIGNSYQPQHFSSIAADDVFIPFQFFMDVNSDGLSDWVSGDSLAFSVRLNLGDGTFSPVYTLRLPAGFRLYDTRFDVVDARGRDIQFVRYMNFASALKIIDINGDGTPELLIPSERAVTACADVTAWEGVTQKCGEELYDSVKTERENLSTTPIPAHRLDDSLYFYDALFFDVDVDANNEPRIVLTSQATELVASAYESTVVDGFGKGLSDLVFTFNKRDNTTTFNTASADSPISHTAFGTYINRNIGSAEEGERYALTDSLTSVSDAYGEQASWQYRPLTTGIPSFDGYPLYERDPNYADDIGNSFSFASSMYVVSEFRHRNGNGSQNAIQYLYRGAVYESLGRGFMGFRTIAEKNVAKGTVLQSDFSQQFPFHGSMVTQGRFAANQFSGAEPIESDDSSAYNITSMEWRINEAHADIYENKGVYSIYQADSVTTKKDYKNLSHVLLTKRSQITNIDECANPTEISTTVDDEFGTRNVQVTTNYSNSSCLGFWSVVAPSCGQ